jgi:DHA1 family bicyclomycin/chloramphenicol resistance-like MFS transporter
VRHPPLLALIVILGIVATLAPLGIDGFLPATRGAAAQLGTDAAGIQVTLAAFTIGIAFGQVVHGTLSDRIGRKRALIGALLLMSLACAGGARAGSLDGLVAWRVLQGFAAAAGMTIARAVVRDLFERERAARVMSYMTVVSGVGPIVFPIVAGLLAVNIGWRAVPLFAAAYGAIAALVFALTVPETHVRRDTEPFSPAAMLLAWRTALSNARFRHYLYCNCCGNLGLFAFLAAAPKVVMTTLGVAPDVFGLYFAATTVFFSTGAFLSGRLVGGRGIDAVMALGAAVMLGAGLLAAGLALAGVSSVLAVMAPVALFLAGYGILVPSATAGALTPFPQIAGAASSAMGLTQQLAAAASTFTIAALGASQDALALGLAVSGAGIAALALRPRRVV